MYKLTSEDVKSMKKCDCLRIVENEEGKYIDCIFRGTEKQSEYHYTITIEGMRFPTNKRNIALVGNSIRLHSILDTVKKDNEINIAFVKNSHLNDLLKKDDYMTESVELFVKKNKKFLQFELYNQVVKNDAMECVRMINYK